MTSKRIAAAVAALLIAAPAACFALQAFGQDFESLDQASGTALGDAGWLVFANVFDPGMSYLYGYGVFPAPNGSGGFCSVATGEGGAGQGTQQLVVFSDYNNGDHAVGNFIESNVFLEQTVAAGDVGQTWVFDFQAKKGDLAGGATALAFIKTLDPNAGYAQTNFVTVDLTAAAATWTDYQLTLVIDAALEGQLLQVGFSNTATFYDPSGIFYDNVTFHVEGQTPTRAAAWGEVKALYR